MSLLFNSMMIFPPPLFIYPHNLGDLMYRTILTEIKRHAPFTFSGAVSGIVIMLLFQNLPKHTAFNIFYILHPLHVFLSAWVTASIFKLHSSIKFDKSCIKGKYYFIELLVIGYTGSIGIATLSDCIIPYISEVILNMPHRHIHLGFVEMWWLITPLAIAGTLLAYFWPKTKLPHAGHVLLSTWASVFHIIMAIGSQLFFISYFFILVFVFISGLAPCCMSDIVFPLLFVRNSQNKKLEVIRKSFKFYIL